MWNISGPNFARNFVQTGSLHLISQGVSPLVLYNYLLSHEKQYGMHVIRCGHVPVEIWFIKSKVKKIRIGGIMNNRMD